MATPESLSIYPDSKPEQETQLSATSRRRRRLLASLALSVAGIEAIYTMGYQLPVHMEEELLSHSSPSLIEVAPQPQHSSYETIVMGGYGVKTSAPIASVLSPLHRLGGIEAVDQANEGIDASVIAGEIMTQAHAAHVTKVGLWGDSIGGDVMIQIARIIQEDHTTPLEVSSLILDCSPSDFDSLRPATQQHLELLRMGESIFPDLQNYLPFDYLYTVTQLPPTQPQVTTALEVSKVLNKMTNPATPSGNLLAAEAAETAHMTVQADLHTIADSHKRKPLIIYLRPTSNTGDAVVNSSLAGADYHRFTTMDKLPFTIHELPGISHADPTSNQRQYQVALQNVIVPEMETYAHLPPSPPSNEDHELLASK